jgi:hypothetical protein
MKKVFFGLVATGFLALSGVSQIQAAFILNFDENCNGTVSTDGGASFQVDPCALITDPTPGGVNGRVVTYSLPNLVISGDVGVLEFGSTSQLSDVISFTNAAGSLDGTQNADRMIFYSLAGEGPAELADTGFPNIAITNDVATEDANGNFTWSPAPNVYNGVSPEAPEPATMVLFGTGLAGLAIAGRKRRNKA